MVKSSKHASKSTKSTSAKRAKAHKTKRPASAKTRRAAKPKKSAPSSAKATPKVRKSAPKRSTSAYNVYMQQAVAQIKIDDPDLPHQEAFKQAAHEWATSPENPKNQ